MIFTGKLLNSEASLNSFRILGNAEFMPGTDLLLAIQLFNSELGIRYVLPSTAIISVEVQQNNSDPLVKTASFIDAGDRSLFSVAFSQAETTEMSGGNILFTIDVLGDGTLVYKGYIVNALSRNTTGSPCC